MASIVRMMVVKYGSSYPTILASFSARIARIDSDAMRRKNELRDTLNAFKAKKIDLLIGTQMIAKGLHFPAVTLVGILNADIGLHIPDFRAGERTFQLLTQVAGRAGRGELVLQRCRACEVVQHRPRGCCVNVGRRCRRH